MFEHLGVDIDSRHRGIDRSCPQVEQAGSAGADQNDPSFDIVWRSIAGKHLPGGNILRLVVVREFEKDPASTIGRHNDVADADVIEAGGLSKSRLATRV